MNTPKVIDIINFHGIVLWVIASEGISYVAAKPLSDLAKVDWRSAKSTFQQEENVVLYGSKWLNHPDFAGQGGTSTPTPAETGLYIRLDRARMYFARINTRHMKAKGAVEAAEQLLALQIEWAEAIHQYETTGAVVKRQRRDDRSQLVGLLKARSLVTDGAERKAITTLIHEALADAGCEVVVAKSAQGDLLDGNHD